MKRKTVFVYVSGYEGEFYISGLSEKRAERGDNDPLLLKIRSFIEEHAQSKVTNPNTREITVVTAPGVSFVIGDQYITTNSKNSIDWLREHFPAKYRVDWDHE